MTAILAGGVLFALAATPTLAASGKAGGPPAEPQRSKAGAVYLEAVSGLRLQTPIDYLSPDADLDAKPETPPKDDLASGRSEPLEWGATGFLVALALLLAFFLWLGRGQLADLMGPRNRQFDSGSAAVFGTPEAELDRDLIARLRRESDPRRGLRQVLERFLKLAAEDNAIVLKRSLTTRELMQRLPGSWRHRSELETLARQTELVLFGGREIAEADYQRCLDLAEPHLRRTAA
ncbi:DUF4129 domain-containing protein [Jiella endophytica]|uniref:DUF4129 domain-containing protein n=1 Tax=Jiella endophytica TaxID=2558362 RepID=A0A4Y8RPV8_9HYPH|nr:DUF4129 domain-containing protein [Jiella endophytica]TFF25351.1 DUF4129 domain-containing protein [Jiella endophytica]